MRLGSPEWTQTVNHTRAHPQVEQHHGESYTLMEERKKNRASEEMLIFEMFSHGRNQQANSILNQECFPPVCLRPLHMHHWPPQLRAFQRLTSTGRQQLRLAAVAASVHSPRRRGGANLSRATDDLRSNGARSCHRKVMLRTRPHGIFNG